MCVVRSPLDFISRKTEELGEGTEGEREREREGGRDTDGKRGGVERGKRGLRREVVSSDLFYKDHSCCYVGTVFRETRMKAGRLIRTLLL